MQWSDDGAATMQPTTLRRIAYVSTTPLIIAYSGTCALRTLWEQQKVSRLSPNFPGHFK